MAASETRTVQQIGCTGTRRKTVDATTVATVDATRPARRGTVSVGLGSVTIEKWCVARELKMVP